jgi:carboxymethylenebutenolidase
MAQAARMTSFQSGRRQLEGYIARPEGDGPFPGIVVIHEIFGLNENMKDTTRRFADQGYVALAVDLFAGRNRTICMFRFMSGWLFNSLRHGSKRCDTRERSGGESRIAQSCQPMMIR